MPGSQSELAWCTACGDIRDVEKKSYKETSVSPHAQTAHADPCPLPCPAALLLPLAGPSVVPAASVAALPVRPPAHHHLLPPPAHACVLPSLSGASYAPACPPASLSWSYSRSPQCSPLHCRLPRALPAPPPPPPLPALPPHPQTLACSALQTTSAQRPHPLDPAAVLPAALVVPAAAAAAAAARPPSAPACDRPSGGGTWWAACSGPQTARSCLQARGYTGLSLFDTCSGRLPRSFAQVVCPQATHPCLQAQGYTEGSLCSALAQVHGPHILACRRRGTQDSLFPTLAQIHYLHGVACRHRRNASGQRPCRLCCLQASYCAAKKHRAVQLVPCETQVPAFKFLAEGLCQKATLQCVPFSLRRLCRPGLAGGRFFNTQPRKASMHTFKLTEGLNQKVNQINQKVFHRAATKNKAAEHSHEAWVHIFELAEDLRSKGVQALLLT
eukprot:scaffold6466_cov18-Tisochrysis_lutea.AAC.1